MFEQPCGVTQYEDGSAQLVHRQWKIELERKGRNHIQVFFKLALQSRDASVHMTAGADLCKQPGKFNITD